MSNWRNIYQIINPIWTANLVCKYVITHMLSQVINEHTEQNFPELMNSLRIEHATQLMKQQSYLEEKLIAIAYDSGFNNKVSFNNAFKNAKGMTPSEYRKKLPPFGEMSLAT